MKKFFLAKIVFVLTIVLGLSSCKNFIVRFGGFYSMNAYYNKASELILKNWEPDHATLNSKLETTGITEASFEKNRENENRFIVPEIRSTTTPPKKLWKNNYEDINKGITGPVLKVQHQWIICKPQFIRVRPDSYGEERNPSETLLERMSSVSKERAL